MTGSSGRSSSRVHGDYDDAAAADVADDCDNDDDNLE
jgi:hypothetical protein